jgi:hypothetical protein
MSMHLCGPGLTTTSTKQRKKKLTDNQYHKMCMDWRTYNKDMRRMGLKEKTLDEYIAYRRGRLKYTPKVIKDPFKAETFRRESPKVESGIGIGVGGARKENVYTGTLIKGIATMHKSNAVPIINQEQAVEISQMRRS